MKVRVLLILMMALTTSVFSQDTLKVTLPQADSILIARNLSLIVSHYQVDIAVANRVQARLFNNPEIYSEWNLYNPDKSKWLDVGDQGQKIVGIQQVFNIAGQRHKAILITEEQKRLSEYEFYDLARSLRFELHAAFFRHYFLNRAINNIQSQMALLRNLINVYQQQYEKGNISLQELTRLNTTYFNISNQVNQARVSLLDVEEKLKILLAERSNIQPVVSDPTAPSLPTASLVELQQRAMTNRPDLKAIESTKELSRLQLSLEKSTAFPSLAAGAVYDQAGSYVNNYTGLTLGFQIPLFNRNQGRIRAANISIKQSESLYQLKQQSIEQEVEQALGTFNLLHQQYSNFAKDSEQQLVLLSKGLVSNYSKNNISLLEFTDLFESYNTNIIQYNQLLADLNESYEELNYVVGEALPAN
jgi:cobalt-zinc-cadmium efflux system outer membrane protein